MFKYRVQTEFESQDDAMFIANLIQYHYGPYHEVLVIPLEDDDNENGNVLDEVQESDQE
jgi:hypothetical protein